MSDGMVRIWRRMFREGRTNVHDGDWSGRPSLLAADLLDGRNEKIALTLRLLTHYFLLAAERFGTNDEAKTAMQHWVKTLAQTSTRGYRNFCPDISYVSVWVAIISRSS
jgi:hypothetical protein